jgi:hypothetical protein
LFVHQLCVSYRPPALPFKDPAEQQYLQNISALSLQQRQQGSEAAAAAAAAASGSSSSTATTVTASDGGIGGDSSSGSVFGLNARSQFLIDFQAWTFLNHGAFGSVSRCVLQLHLSHGPLSMPSQAVYTQSVGWGWHS